MTKSQQRLSYLYFKIQSVVIWFVLLRVHVIISFILQGQKTIHIGHRTLYISDSFNKIQPNSLIQPKTPKKLTSNLSLVSSPIPKKKVSNSLYDIR
jgi:hypothetical protein